MVSSHGHEAICRLLLHHGANINAVDDKGETPLLSACFGRASPSVVELLLQHGASMEVSCVRNGTPLHAASWKGATATVGVLL